MFLVFLIFSVVYLSTGYGYITDPGPSVIATRGEVWPKVQTHEKSNDYLILDADLFEFNLLSKPCTTIRNAFARYNTIIVSDYTNLARVQENSEEDDNFVGYLKILNVTLNGGCHDNEYPSINMKEDYNLVIQSDIAQLSSNSVWGILRGLETFSQLFYEEDDGSSMKINTTTIYDFPRFPHRGLLLDTARHFIPIDKIFDTLDAMAYNKLNVFHWHIVDDQSFPYISREFPEISKEGAFSSNDVYTVADVKDVLDYARERGIRVLPEFNTPAHTRSWGVSHKELLAECYKDGVITEKLGPIDPSKEETYKFLQSLFKEVCKVFPDQYVHLGGNDVGYECWEGNPAITSFMNDSKLETYKELEKYYTEKLMGIIHSFKSSPVVWDDVIGNGVELPKETIVQVASSVEKLASIVASGKQAILSSCWNLSHTLARDQWREFYRCEPHDFSADKEQKKLVLGGEVCVWTDTINEFNILSRVWPRASAVAEKLWSDINIKDEDDASLRLEEQSCRMIKRGIDVEPPNGAGYCP